MPDERLFPEIHAVKQMIKKTLESRDVFLYCDFHGHSRSRNAFIYGCSGANNFKPKDNQPISNFKYKERVFPYLMSKNCDYFSYDGCNFSVQKAKE